MMISIFEFLPILHEFIVDKIVDILLNIVFQWKVFHYETVVR